MIQTLIQNLPGHLWKVKTRRACHAAILSKASIWPVLRDGIGSEVVPDKSSVLPAGIQAIYIYIHVRIYTVHIYIYMCVRP